MHQIKNETESLQGMNIPRAAGQRAVNENEVVLRREVAAAANLQAISTVAMESLNFQVETGRCCSESFIQNTPKVDFTKTEETHIPRKDTI
ncbi:unnamed protein product [Caretta caretta]